MGEVIQLFALPIYDLKPEEELYDYDGSDDVLVGDGSNDDCGPHCGCHRSSDPGVSFWILGAVLGWSI